MLQWASLYCTEFFSLGIIVVELLLSGICICHIYWELSNYVLFDTHQLCTSLCFSRPMPKDYTTYCFPVCWVLRISHSWFHFAFLKFLVRLSPPPHTYLFAIWIFCDLCLSLVHFSIGLSFSHWLMDSFIFWILIICNYTHWKYHFLSCGLSFSFVYGIFFCLVWLLDEMVISFLSFMAYVPFPPPLQGYNSAVLFHI